MKKRVIKKRRRIENKRLCKRYPFLIPRNVWTDRIPSDYHYEYTELDAMEPGWRKAFGIQMCEEIRQELIRCNYLDKFRIMQIKEKFGTLCFYTNGIPQESNIFDIIDKYEAMSAHICMNCGKPAETKDSDGWLDTLCDSCAKQQANTVKQRLASFKRRHKYDN